MERENNETPDFDFLEMERGSLGSPPAPGAGRRRRPEPVPKMSLQLSVPLSGEELKRLCDVAFSLDMDIEVMVRQAILSFIGIKEMPTRSFFPERERSPSRAGLPLEEREEKAEAVAEKVKEVELSPKEGVDMTTHIREGTGYLITPDERQYLITADYKIWEQLWEAEGGGGWSGELIMMSDMPLGEYVIQLKEGDGRSGRIILSDIQETASPGYKAYLYKFRGIGALINEWEELR